MTLSSTFLRRDGTLQALTLWPEWPWAVHFLDKRIENRDWRIPIGRWFAMHAGAHVGGRKGTTATVKGWQALTEMATHAGWALRGNWSGRGRWSASGQWRPFEFCKGETVVLRDPLLSLESHIHGLFRVTSYITGNHGGWHVSGQIGNVFDYLPLVEPVPCKGAQGLWTVPAEVVGRMRLQP